MIKLPYTDKFRISGCSKSASVFFYSNEMPQNLDGHRNRKDTLRLTEGGSFRTASFKERDDTI